MYGYIYRTTNLINNKKYIGQHKSSMFDNNYYGSGIYLKKALDKYGKDNFKIEILEECDSNDILNIREIYWIDYFNAVEDKNYYNISKGGNVTNSGKILSEDTKYKISVVNKGNKYFLGKHHSSETRQKLSKSHKDIKPWNKDLRNVYKHTDEAKRKISEASKNRTPWNKGLKLDYSTIFSDDVRKYLSEINMGNTNTKNRIWINYSGKTKMIYKNQLDKYIKLGWKLGRK